MKNLPKLAYTPPRIKRVGFTLEYNNGKPYCMATQEEAKRGLRIVNCIRVDPTKCTEEHRVGGGIRPKGAPIGRQLTSVHVEIADAEEQNAAERGKTGLTIQLQSAHLCQRPDQRESSQHPGRLRSPARPACHEAVGSLLRRQTLSGLLRPGQPPPVRHYPGETEASTKADLKLHKKFVAEKKLTKGG
ncbi:MAG: hypothetical protein DRQ02_07220 [Candidatus Latescibacterota bacterium]|nr:MAG: hypothetical protein DRQ02_07220 [Candidatus Latescibacterota bacterium]